MICAIWSIPNLSSHFKENIIKREGITWCSAGDDLKDILKKEYEIDSLPIIAGVSPEEFKPIRTVTHVRKVGINGVPFVNQGWDEVKQPQRLIDIAKAIHGEAVFIHGKDLSEGTSMYDGIDMYICTSTNDRGPYGIAEAAFCKIPVLSTNTGFATKFKSIMTFNTVEEAIEIINDFNKNPFRLKAYANMVYKELSQELNWKTVAEKYWKPVFESKLSLNKSR